MNNKNNITLASVAKALGGTVANGQVRAPGPGHSAIDASLSVKLDDSAPDGFIVNSFSPSDDPIKCRDYVREKLGLPAFQSNGRKPRRSNGDIERALVEAVNSQVQDRKPAGTLTNQYSYKNEDGALLYQVLRYENPKTFRQRRPDGNGGWIYGLGDVRRVPYRLPDLITYPDATIFVCEGEKDADNVSDLNLCATTVAAGSWTADCVQPLSGRNLIILQDNDVAGKVKAQKAAQLLSSVASSIRVVLLPGLPDKGDVSDWLSTVPRRGQDELCNACFD